MKSLNVMEKGTPMILSNEDKLLLDCLRSGVDVGRQSKLKSLVDLPLDWDELIRSAETRGISSLVYKSLNGTDAESIIPASGMERLRNAYHLTAAQNMFFYSEVQRILKAFKKADIDAMLLKGAALSATVYDDIGLRTMKDIDILVHEKSLNRAKAVMQILDYKAQTQIKPEKWYRENHFHLPVFIHRKKSLAVEIHWNISKVLPGYDIEQWWQRALEIEISGTPVLVPCAEDMIFHLCLHLYHNSFNEETGLKGLSDIAHTIQYYSASIDWDIFTALVNMCEFRKPVYSVLFLVKKHFCTHEQFLPMLDTVCIDSKFVALIEELIFGQGDETKALFIRSMGAETVGKTTQEIISHVFLSQVEMSNRYPVKAYSAKAYIYYIYRCLELAFKYGKCVPGFIRLNTRTEA